ncbi:D-alanyl-D-alanine carboxypeptidase [Streptomyces sp. NBC_01460]|uniref:D-alanyl-D-alanine carboxypeptidase n=1 Tax=Streptomyces sp. NBC_01460 TaxID=2903875 RepID=UPI002E34E5C8|nr:D-alanyl-D-alanine carboxypeptidase [Streptomyces sp. NBC_01460]
MAGESPDKSEQRKSSGTTGERDPRLAVFREPGAGSDGSPAGGTAGPETDSRTAVFRLPASGKTGAAEGAVAPAEGTEGPEGASEPREGADGTPDAQDVAGAARKAPEASVDADEASGGADEASADADEASGAGSGAESDDESGARTEPAADAEGDGDAQSEADAEDGTGPAEDKTPPETAADTGSSDAASTPTDARLRAAVAAWVATDADEEAAARSGASEGENENGNKGEAESEDGSADSADATSVAEAKAADADAETPADSDGGARSADADADAGADSDTEVSAESDADAEPDAEPENGAETEAGAETGSEPDAETSTDTETSAEAPAVSASEDAPRVPRTRKEATPAEDAEPVSDGRGIDHPTAVFKALRTDQVDQPTTALKLPRKATEAPRKPASWAAKASGASEAPAEAPAERTSKFVPLRSDDVRPAAVVGPTITPDVAAGPGTPASPGAGLTEAERTRQQPMPPKPPLDLLAELTNTPPPRETPVRTAVRRVKIWTPLVLLALIVFAIAQAVRPLPDPALTLSASPTYTFGGEKLDMPWPAEGQGAVEVEGVGAIGSYGKEKSAPIASMAKVMTAYVILQGHPITGEQTGDQIEVDKQAGDEASLEDESRVAIKEGDKYTERQMLEMLMIPSGNNVARLLARWDAGTEKAFIEKMNAAAEDLGMTNSTYTDPSGLKSSTMSTPADQIALGKAVMQNDVFRKIVNLPQADIPGVGRIYNNNYILLEPGVSGIKTGSSTPAGGNLLWTAETVVDGKSRRIIGAVMGANLEGTLDAKLERARQNSLKLIRAAQKGVDSATVVKKGQVVGYVDNGLGGQTPVVATKDLKAVGWGGLEVDLKMTDGGKAPAHQAAAGTVVGEVTVGTGTGKVSVPVALQGEMTEPTFGDKLTRIT